MRVFAVGREHSCGHCSGQCEPESHLSDCALHFVLPLVMQFGIILRECAAAVNRGWKKLLQTRNICRVNTEPAMAEIAPKIDAYNHYIPPAYLDLLQQHSKDTGIVKRMSSIRVLW